MSLDQLGYCFMWMRRDNECSAMSVGCSSVAGRGVSSDGRGAPGGGQAGGAGRRAKYNAVDELQLGRSLFGTATPAPT